MDSSGSTLTLRTRTMPFTAILRHELRSLWSSWLVRLWLGATFLLTFLIMASNWATFQSAPFIAALLFPYLVFPWFLVVMVLGISPVTGSRLEALADGILSRPVTRFEYLFASWAARVVMVLFVFLVVIVPFMLLIAYADRPVAGEDVTLYGMFGAVLVVGLVLTFLVSLGFLMGTLLRRPMVAAVILIFTWIPINLILNTFSLEEFSPFSLNQAIPTLLRTPWSEEEEETVEETVSKEDADAVARQAAQVISILSGKSAPPPASKPDFFNRTEYEDFSLTRVILGYTLPTLAAIGLAMLCFCWRDL